MSEQQPLLPSAATTTPATTSSLRKRRIITVVAPLVLVAATVFVVLFGERRPKEPLALANYYLKTSPVIDGHIDLPILARSLVGNDINKLDLRSRAPGHVDIPRIREGQLGGFFWSVYTDCHAEQDGPDFLNPSYHVRDTLEQIDVALNLIDKYDDTFRFVKTADEAVAAIKAGRVASFLGIEGAHQLGNSLAVLRQYYTLGVRYATLTHSCNNAFADSGGFITPVNETWGGLSTFGQDLIKEMNRLGMLIDLSHVSDKTAEQAIELSRAPVMWSHSAARGLNNISRNVPDELLSKIGQGRKQLDGVVMVNFYPAFASKTPAEVDVAYIADEIEYIAGKTGRAHVGIGSDYDGIESVPKGLEDVSKYPHLFAELIRRGWSKHDLAGLAGGNIIRVLRGAEEVAHKLRKRAPSMAKYSKRHDLDPRPLP
ncbi:Putative dipeptidase [Vanrija pseudolonga]|uniref:Dipeptidase n=1 Tax=Vanrija pseudolonga TaxID=143232 RepID=A0AAF0YBK2_9TREE|nr:Putative dipeptidase [Vanrija pseudolonga]